MATRWERDLEFANKDGGIATLFERQTRYVMLVKVASNERMTEVDALIKSVRRPPNNCIVC